MSKYCGYPSTSADLLKKIFGCETALPPNGWEDQKRKVNNSPEMALISKCMYFFVIIAVFWKDLLVAENKGLKHCPKIGMIEISLDIERCHYGRRGL